MKRWKVLVAGLALGSGLCVAPATAAKTGAPALTTPRALPGGPSWNQPAGGLSWEKLRGKVVIVDFWNSH